MPMDLDPSFGPLRNFSRYQEPLEPFHDMQMLDSESVAGPHHRCPVVWVVGRIQDHDDTLEPLIRDLLEPLAAAVMDQGFEHIHDPLRAPAAQGQSAPESILERAGGPLQADDVLIVAVHGRELTRANLPGVSGVVARM